VDVAIIGEGNKVLAGSLDMEDDDDGNISSLCITCLFLKVQWLTGRCTLRCFSMYVKPTHHALLISYFKNIMEVQGDAKIMLYEVMHDGFWEC
jgi:hypothetical protein